MCHAPLMGWHACENDGSVCVRREVQRARGGQEWCGMVCQSGVRCAAGRRCLRCAVSNRMPALLFGRVVKKLAVTDGSTAVMV